MQINLCWLHQESRNQREHGQASLLIRKHLIKDIQDIQYVNKRYLRLDLRIYSRDVIFLVYAPIKDSVAHMKEMFYEILGQQLNQVRYL